MQNWRKKSFEIGFECFFSPFDWVFCSNQSFDRIVSLNFVLEYYFLILSTPSCILLKNNRRFLRDFRMKCSVDCDFLSWLLIIFKKWALEVNAYISKITWATGRLFSQLSARVRGNFLKKIPKIFNNMAFFGEEGLILRCATWENGTLKVCDNFLCILNHFFDA